ncbi:methyltransferase domain-containing protein [Candidatus Woesearchaeota archaeon]|nr:methyltransferase domain-containing protein [Candidatus Woesearchaeota archaeon]
MVKPLLIKAVELARKGKALDIGAANGYDSLFLACKGFNVTAVEKDEYLSKEISDMNLEKIHVFNQNISSFNFEKYTLINCCFVLHFLKNKTRGIIKKIQQSTAKDGVNVIITFLNEGEFNNKHEGLLKPNELKEMYSDWEMIVYAEKFVQTKEKNKDGSVKEQKAAFLLAKKSN